MITDLTDQYDTKEFQRTATDWYLSRYSSPVRAVILHHTAGFYGVTTRAAAAGMTISQEREQIRRLAVDHRSRFGIGPGYHYAVFPSGSIYAIGKAGTHRAHTKGRNPNTGVLWNRSAIGIVAFGDYETTAPPLSLVAGLREAVEDVKRWTGDYGLPVYAHGNTPTANSAGTVYKQETACPGKLLLDAMEAPEPEEPEVEVDVPWLLARLDDLEFRVADALDNIRESLGVDTG